MYIDSCCNSMIWCPGPKNATLMVPVVALIPWSNTGQRQQHLPAPSDSKFLPLQGFFISFAVARVQKLHPGAMRPKPPAVVGRGPSLFSWSKERILAARVKWCQGKFDRFRQDKLGYLCFGSAALIYKLMFAKKTRCLHTHDCCISMAQNLSAIRIDIETQLILIIAQFYLKSVGNATNQGDS